MTDIDVDYGPLTELIGTWEGGSGKDVSPEPDGVENNSYYERIVFNPIGIVTNAEEQDLAVISYQQQVFRKSDQKRIHDQVGYWMWDSESNQVINSFVIPRGVAVLAGGQFDEVSGNIRVSAEVEGPWKIVQTEFMNAKALTEKFEMTLEVSESALSYSQVSTLKIYGTTFEHTESSSLLRAD